METALRLERRTAGAHAALLAVVVVWASAFAAIKALLDHAFAPGDIAALRYLVPAPGFAFVLRRAGGLPGLTRSDAVRLAAVGVCVVVGYHVALNAGTRSTTAGTAALVVALSPALTLPLAAALGLDRWSVRRAAGLTIAFAGVAVVVLLGAEGELSLADAKGPLSSPPRSRSPLHRAAPAPPRPVRPPALLISPLAVAMGAVFLGEPVTGWVAAGGALVLGGVAVAESASR